MRLGEWAYWISLETWPRHGIPDVFDQVKDHPCGHP
jgi:hypothetical protein